MPNFGTFDLASAYGAAEDIKGARQDQQLRGLQMEAAKLSLDEAKKPKLVPFEEMVQNTQMLNAASTAIAEDPSAAAYWVPQLQRAGVMTPEANLANVPPEQLQTLSKQIAAHTGRVLQVIEQSKDKTGKVPTELQIMAARGVDIADPAAVNAFIETERAKKQADDLQRASAGKTNVDVSMRLPPQEGAEAKKVGEEFGQMYVDTQKAAASANGKIARLDQLSNLLAGVETGKLTPATTTLAAYGESLGIKVDKKLPAKQAVAALTGEMALQMRNPSGGAGMPGAMSDKDREFLMSIVPGLANTPGGNALIIGTWKKLAQRDIEVAKMAREYRIKNKQLDDGFYSELAQFSAANPLFPQSATPGGKRRVYNPATGKIE